MCLNREKSFRKTNRKQGGDWEMKENQDISSFLMRIFLMKEPGNRIEASAPASAYSNER